MHDLRAIAEDMFLTARQAGISAAVRADLNGKAEAIGAMAEEIVALIDAEIGVAMSEQGAFATVVGDPVAAEFEPWTAMDRLLAVLDAARPGWRETARREVAGHV